MKELLERFVLLALPGAVAWLGVVTIGCQNPSTRVQLPHLVDADELDEPVRRQLLASRDAVTRLQTAGDQRDQALGRALGNLAMVYHAYRDYEPARRCYRQAHDLDRQEFHWAYLLARVERSLGHLDESDDAFDEALILRPDYLPALVWRAENAVDDNRLVEAEEGFRRALEVTPTCAQANYGLARVALSRGDAESAIEFLDSAHEQQREATPILYSLGLAHRSLGDAERAQFFLERIPTSHLLRRSIALDDPVMREVHALELGATAYEHRGQRAAARGQYGLAASELRQAVILDGERIEARHNLALALLHLGRGEEARGEIDEILQLHPDFAPTLVLLGRLLQRDGELEEAEHHLRRATKADPASAKAHLALAELLVSIGDRDAARLASERARLLDPNVETKEAATAIGGSGS
ncbi:MAG: tetratricopeptide repeat protein [Thermoanaerobaculia bacterium]|nr:tetratricopeptide repeat protein [Thermoanaerobaculia bacterium]